MRASFFAAQQYNLTTPSNRLKLPFFQMDQVHVCVRYSTYSVLEPTICFIRYICCQQMLGSCILLLGVREIIRIEMRIPLSPHVYVSYHIIVMHIAMSARIYE